MEILSLRCKYAYDGGAKGETFGSRNKNPIEEWEITFGYCEKKQCIIVHNLTQNYTQVIHITEEKYKKIVREQGKEIAEYMKIAYELHLEELAAQR